MRTISKRTGTVAAVIAVVLGGGVAWAAWVATGSGTATAEASGSVEITTLATTTTGKLLYPGGKGDLTVNVFNDNDYPVQINTVAQDDERSVTAGEPHRANGCAGSATGVSLLFTTGVWVIPAHTNKEIKLVDRVKMTNASSNACQGASFTIPVLLVGQSSA